MNLEELSEDEKKIIQVSKDFRDFLEYEYILKDSISFSADNTLNIWHNDPDNYIQAMKEEINDETEDYNYVSKLEAFSRKASPKFSALDETEINPEGVGRITNKIVFRLQTTLLKAIDTLLDEININKINIELYERERQTTKKLENSLSEKKWEETILQEENWKKRKNIEKLNQHIDLAHQDIENLRNEIEEERQIHEEAMATMDEWYRSIRPSDQESEQKRKELFNEILELGWEINQQSKENKELKQTIKIGKEIAEQEISDHQKKNQNLQKEIVDYKKKIINLKKEFENLKGINKLSEIILNEKKSKWKNKKQKFQKEINRLKKLNKNQETDYENYRKEKDNEITNKDNQHHQLNTEKDKIKCLEDNIDNLEKQINHLSWDEENNYEQQESIEELQYKIKEQKNELEKLIQELTKQKKLNDLVKVQKLEKPNLTNQIKPNPSSYN